MRRELVCIEEVADVGHLAWAFWRASRGKRRRAEVRAMAADLDGALGRLSQELRAGTVPLGESRRFVVHDPKQRVIHAPVFRERVVHHALMARLGPSLDRLLGDDSYACRPGKGSLAAAERARLLMRRSPWLVKVHVRRFFDGVRHDRLRELIHRRVKGRAVLDLCDRIIATHHTAPGRGLPVGALTSQHFANAYLASLDRLLLETLKVRGMVRYMDDVLWWCQDREAALASLDAVRTHLHDERGLELNSTVQVRRVEQGVTICGFQIVGDRMRLSRRRRLRHDRVRRGAERAFREGVIDAGELQRRGDVALAITAHADAVRWRRSRLQRLPAPDA